MTEETDTTVFAFSEDSRNRLKGVDEQLKLLMKIALSASCIDFGIPPYGGLRTAEEQNALYKNGKSQLDGYSGKSKHQSGKAIDVYAYVHGAASWNPDYYKILAGVILSAAKDLGIKVRWGGDWDMDWDFKDQSFNDLVHYELVE